MFLSDLSTAGKRTDRKIYIFSKTGTVVEEHINSRGSINTCLVTWLTCSFFISFLRSASYFSFWFALAAL